MNYTTEREVEDFIQEYLSSRVAIESSVRAILNRALEYERKFHKVFYTFTKEETMQMFKDVGAISATSLLNMNVILKHAANYQLFSKGIKLSNNVFEVITKDDLKLCINHDKKQKMIITREQLMDIEDQLLNYTDKAIITLLFLGIGCEDWCSELTFMQEKQISKTDMCIYFNNGKRVEIDQHCYNVLIKSAAEDELISYTGLRVSKVAPQGVVFKTRFNSLNANDNIKDPGDKERRFRWAQRRIKIINNYLGLNLTPSSLADSGLLHEIRRGIALNDIPFRQYVTTEECQMLAARYGIHSAHYAVTLVEKFKTFFE